MAYVYFSMPSPKSAPPVSLLVWFSEVESFGSSSLSHILYPDPLPLGHLHQLMAWSLVGLMLCNIVSWCLAKLRAPTSLQAIPGSSYRRCRIFDLWTTPLAMPLGERTQRLIKMMESLKGYRICLSCGFEYIRTFVSEQLGCEHMISFFSCKGIFIVICSPKTRQSSKALYFFKTRQDWKSLHCVSKDCQCEDLGKDSNMEVDMLQYWPGPPETWANLNLQRQFQAAPKSGVYYSCL